jgi:F-type H+-transporting ATPase subunit delta
MLIGGATKRYAQAIFEIARDTDSFDAWQRDLDVMAQLVADETGRALFESPNVDNARKWQVASQFLSPRVQPRALNLARLLVERGRFAQADRIATAFAELVREHRGIAVAEVTTAVPLDQATTEIVGRQLAAIVGKQIELRPHVDPSIIGGVIARVGDYLIDGSVTGRLSRLRGRLAEGR